MANESKTYDITEYAKKALNALRSMEANQQPGQLTTGGKTDVVRHIKDDIKALMDKGYTAQQISDALKQDVFSILPKSITEVVKGKKQAATKRPRQPQQPPPTQETKPAPAQASKPASQATNTGTTAATKHAAKPVTSNVQGNSGTFEIKPDTPNGEL